MHKPVVATCLLCVLGMLAGCTAMSNSVPGASVPLEGLDTSASYEIMGPAQGTSTGGVLFWFIPIGRENKSGVVATQLAQAQKTKVNFANPFWPFAWLANSVSTRTSATLDPIMSAAIYNAIESVPDADALLAPRWQATKKSYFIYSERTLTVKGKCIRIVSPVAE